MKDKLLNNLKVKKFFSAIYGSDDRVIQKQVDRYGKLLEKFETHFGRLEDSDIHLFSTPGRTEISGNHTDHNHGRVLAAAVNLDAACVAAKVPGNRVRVFSEGYDAAFEVNLEELEPKKEEQGTTHALIRGIAARFRELGCQTGGFNACLTSDVLLGSGLSSSAVIEVLLADILNALYNDRKINAETLAIIGQYAENNYFGKPCGLMDQLTCAVGGIVTIDFKDPQKPGVKKVDFDFSREDFSILVVDTGGSHADLTGDYAAIPREMKAAAGALGHRVCREIEDNELIRNIKKLRRTAGDRAILRALHFMEENRRVELQVEALENKNFDLFLHYVRESGNSSMRWLQNCFTTKNTTDQGITLALALTERYIKRARARSQLGTPNGYRNLNKFSQENKISIHNSIGKGACRVHGGGFAGTIQAFLPNPSLPGYIKLMESVFGKNCVSVLSIRPHGTRCLRRPGGSFEKPPPGPP